MKPGMAMIITAGGMSRRHPPNKLLMCIEGRTVIEKTIGTFLSFPGKIVLVTGFEEEKIQHVLQNIGLPFEVAHNPGYEIGLSSSIRMGITAAGECDYYGFCTGDKPFIRRSTIRQLIQIIQRRHPDILVPKFEDIPGHPVFFNHRFKSQLMALKGDEGGRQIVRQYHSKTEFVSVGDKGVILDMDNYLDT